MPIFIARLDVQLRDVYITLNRGRVQRGRIAEHQHD
jgi:hypothetical protein